MPWYTHHLCCSSDIQIHLILITIHNFSGNKYKLTEKENKCINKKQWCDFMIHHQESVSLLRLIFLSQTCNGKSTLRLCISQSTLWAKQAVVLRNVFYFCFILINSFVKIQLILMRKKFPNPITKFYFILANLNRNFIINKLLSKLKRTLFNSCNEGRKEGMIFDKVLCQQGYTSIYG